MKHVCVAIAASVLSLFIHHEVLSGPRWSFVIKFYKGGVNPTLRYPLCIYITKEYTEFKKIERST